MSDWRPIETAPKDGTIVLLWSEFSGVQACEWGEIDILRHKGWVFGPARGDYNERLEFDSPSHWMPLPEPPK